jgi:hypothetical protein
MHENPGVLTFEDSMKHYGAAHIIGLSREAKLILAENVIRVL